MTPEQLIPGREYIIKGTDVEHPTGIFQESKTISYSNRGVFLGKSGNGKRTVYNFDSFTLYSDNETTSSKNQLRLGACVTIDTIIEVGHSE